MPRRGSSSFLEGWGDALLYNLFLRVTLTLIVFAVLALALLPLIAAAQVPDLAGRYRHEYARIVRSEWGLDAPIASLAAQIHQESGWNCRAVSRVGARGCAQFMPTTATWIGDVDKRLARGRRVLAGVGVPRAGGVHALAAATASRRRRRASAWRSRCPPTTAASATCTADRSSRRRRKCFGATCDINPGILERTSERTRTTRAAFFSSSRTATNARDGGSDHVPDSSCGRRDRRAPRRIRSRNRRARSTAPSLRAMECKLPDCVVAMLATSTTW
jgi:hypothetical protein